METDEKFWEVLSQARIDSQRAVSLSDYDPALLPPGDKTKVREDAEAMLSRSVKELRSLQELLYADDSRSILLIFQGMDTAGKDSIIRRVMSGLNPQGCKVTSFKHPSAKELEHNFLWRYSKELPERGMIGIFNRSYFEEVLIVRVHSHIYQAQRVPNSVSEKEIWENRFEDINAFERHLSRNGTKILKFFLHLSKSKQSKRLIRRIDNPEKHWKFDVSDIAEREHWDDYTKAYEKMLGSTSTKWAPWHVIPADHKWLSRTLVADVLLNTIKDLDLKYPVTSSEKLEEMKKAREKLQKSSVAL